MTGRFPASLFPRAPQPPEARRRSRWPVFFCGLLLCWCAWWYCRGESQGLLLVAAGLSALAVARARALPATARWIIWGGVLVTVVCLAANVGRLVPPPDALGESRAIERVVTVAFALGLTALFFRCTADGVTLAAVAGLPLAMMVLSRPAEMPGSAAGFEMLIVWGFVALLAAADLAQRLTQPGAPDRAGPGLRELGWRALFLASVAALAFGLQAPVGWAAKGAQKALFGWVMYPERTTRQRGDDLQLALRTAADFGQRMRVVLLVDAPRMPGYLRENAFARYRGGRWLSVKPETPLAELAGPGAAELKNAYALTPSPLPATTAVWRVEVVSAGLLDRFCLPGSAVALACDGAPPLGDTNGTVAAKELLPARYELAVAPRRLLESAYPGPEGLSDPAYLEVPPPLAEAVTNWVAGCAGLAGAPTVRAAIQRVEDHFASNFTYRLGLAVNATPDPLLTFMARKEGACTLFASAATLMFRGCGVPSRLVSGYVCSGWNPWLKRWVVREREGHAWVEVWDAASRQWLVADPTPPCGRPDALARPGKLRQAFDLLVAGWKRALDYLRQATLLEMIADAGAALFRLAWHLVASLPGALALAGLAAVWWFRRRGRQRRLAPAERLRAELALAMRQLERRSVAAHQRRRGHESWSAWLERVGPGLPAARAAELREWVESYQALRYGVRLDEAEARAWLARARRAGRR